jgi:hypothetical protein
MTNEEIRNHYLDIIKKSVDKAMIKIICDNNETAALKSLCNNNLNGIDHITLPEERQKILYSLIEKGLMSVRCYITQKGINLLKYDIDFFKGINISTTIID